MAGRKATASSRVVLRPARHLPYCALEGLGDTDLWSVAASGDATVCTDLSRTLGGRVTASTGRA